MHRYRVPLVFIFILFAAALLLPHAAWALTTPTGGIAASSNCAGGTYAGWGAAISTLNALVQYAVYLGILLSALFLAYGGFLLVLNPMQPENRSKAKNILLNTVIGLFIVLAAWLIVNTLLIAIGYVGGGVQGATQILAGGNNCNQPTQQTSLGAQGQASTGGTGSTGSTTGSNTNGTGGSSISGGSCDASNFSGFGNGSQDSQLSCVCNNESSGNAAALSGTDKTENGQAVSVGLMQINISANNVSCNGQTLDCPSAFNHPFTSKDVHNGSTVQITNQDLYNQCVSDMQNPQCNLQTAQNLYNQSGHSPWLADQNKCG